MPKLLQRILHAPESGKVAPAASDEPSAEHYAVWREQIAQGLAQLTPDELTALTDEIAERAAIMEFDGSLDRAEAERRAEWQTLWLRFGLAAIDGR